MTLAIGAAAASTSAVMTRFWLCSGGGGFSVTLRMIGPGVTPSEEFGAPGVGCGMYASITVSSTSCVATSRGMDSRSGLSSSMLSTWIASTLVPATNSPRYCVRLNDSASSASASSRSPVACD